MSNNATTRDIDKREEFLRESIAIIVRNHGPEDIVRVLAAVMDNYAFEYARKTGDYAGAAAMRIVSDHLDELPSYLENYDGAPLE